MNEQYPTLGQRPASPDMPVAGAYPLPSHSEGARLDDLTLVHKGFRPVSERTIDDAETMQAPPTTYKEAVIRHHDTVQMIAASRDGSIHVDPSQGAEPLRRQREALYASATRAKALYPAGKMAIDIVTGMLDYVWHSPADAPLPLGLFVTVGNRVGVETNLVGRDFVKTVQVLESVGLNMETEGRRRALAVNDEPLRNSFYEVAKQTAGYKLLESFMVSEPQYSDRPLTPAEMQVLVTRRENEAAQKLRTAGAHKSIVARAVQHATYDLDEVTVRRPAGETEPPTPIKRAQTFFEKYIATFATECGGAGTFSVEDHYTIIVDGTEYPMTDVFYPLMKTFRGAFALGHQISEHALSDYVLASAIKGIFDHSASGAPDSPAAYEQLLDAACRDTWDEIAWNRYAPATDLTSLNIDAEVRIHKQLPSDGPLFDIPADFEGIPGALHFDIDKPVGFMTAEVYRALEKTVIGAIHKAPANDWRPRMLMPSDIWLDSLASYDPQEAALIISLRDRNASPRTVPGYTLLGYNFADGTFGYAYNPDADPYQDCTIPLEYGQIAALAQTAENSGAAALSAAIKAAKGLTVKGFVDLLRGASTYVLPSSAEQAQEMSPDHRPASTQELSAFIDAGTGKYKVQCGVMESICSVFFAEAGLGETGQLSGGTLMVPAHTKQLDALTHQQMTFKPAGSDRMYIIDATPAQTRETLASLKRAVRVPGEFAGYVLKLLGSTINGRNGDELEAVLPPIKHVQADPIPEGAAPRLKPVIPDQHRTAPPVLNESQRRSELADIRQELITLLGASFAVKGSAMPEPALFEAISRRPGTDLTRIVLDIVDSPVPKNPHLHPVSLEQTHSRASTVLRYIQELRDQSSPARDPHEYANHAALVTMLERSLLRVVRVTETS